MKNIQQYVVPATFRLNHTRAEKFKQKIVDAINIYLGTPVSQENYFAIESIVDNILLEMYISGLIKEEIHSKVEARKYEIAPDVYKEMPTEANIYFLDKEGNKIELEIEE